MLLVRNVCGIAAVAIVFFATSGQMWNHMNRALLFQMGPAQINFIYPGRGEQFLVETYLAMLMNAGVASGMVLIAEALAIGYREQKIAAWVGLGMIFFFLSLLLSVCRRKMDSYPYRLLF